MQKIHENLIAKLQNQGAAYSQYRQSILRCEFIQAIQELSQEVAVYRAVGSVEEIAAMVTAEQEVRLIIMLCKLGDKVFSSFGRESNSAAPMYRTRSKLRKWVQKGSGLVLFRMICRMP